MQKFNCPVCKQPIELSPNTHKFRCSNCETIYELFERDGRKMVRKLSPASGSQPPKLVPVRCPECAHPFQVNAKSTGFTCPSCQQKYTVIERDGKKIVRKVLIYPTFQSQPEPPPVPAVPAMKTQSKRQGFPVKGLLIGVLVVLFIGAAIAGATMLSGGMFQPEPTATATATATLEPTMTPTPTLEPTATPTVTPSPTVTPTPELVEPSQLGMGVSRQTVLNAIPVENEFTLLIDANEKIIGRLKGSQSLMQIAGDPENVTQITFVVQDYPISDIDLDSIQQVTALFAPDWQIATWVNSMQGLAYAKPDTPIGETWDGYIAYLFVQNDPNGSDGMITAVVLSRRPVTEE